MLGISKKIESASQVDDQLVLPFDRRQKSRLRVELASGTEAALLLERGTVLRGGDLLQAEDGRVVQVVAADEPVLLVTAETAQQLMRAAYHLGNRHVPLEVGNSWLRLEQDHVLQEMLVGLGVQVEGQMAPFEPEAGAYGGGHRHHHDDAPSIRQPAHLRTHG
ncbi:urease accessory protein UreE [Methylobacillus arboreus]|uniref:urease accessory protein UreE n=1 Tax=Methylobacillus arboreus TaxID=755170 RepID=UPI001E43852E|nr:urease accessory protein UreE [Methylobacillus arboreus]MCB5189508.1 urease accessory protein UreE [Methylobacillus arboreus]